MEVYNAEFYTDMEISSVTSAKEIIPILINRYQPISVVDIGCGTGAFAREFIQNGVEDVVGYEGDWMRETGTLLQKDKYIYVDFTNEISATRIYDLCLCLEVAEHLDYSSARTLVSTLTSFSQRVVFSAAIPRQGGNHHINDLLRRVSFLSGIRDFLYGVIQRLPHVIARICLYLKRGKIMKQLFLLH